MKAAIVTEKGVKPIYGDLPEPEAKRGEALIHVEASALSQLAKHRAEGTHYSSSTKFPFVAGVDGVGRLVNGEKVYFLFPELPQGSMAEKVTIPTEHYVSIPESLDTAFAAAIANPGMSSWAALKYRAKIQSGDVVLINGATGTSGTLAVQIAKYLGAAKIIVTGRNQSKLNALLALGADIAIPIENIAEEAPKLFEQGVDIVLDYLWGNSALDILNVAAHSNKTLLRFVQIGSISGDDILLNSKVLRSTNLIVMGSGIGSVSMRDLVSGVGEFLHACALHDFSIPFTTASLSEIEEAWKNNDARCRTVFLI